jgi:pantoate--beta-alanine ligase
MIVFERAEGLTKYIELLKAKKHTIGFVPTMGALHEGHIALIEQAVSENTTVVVSVFVNPTQFNDKKDLENYPRMPHDDFEKCENAGATIVFAPSVEEIYPEPDTRLFDFGNLDKVMEGEHRPGHFNGVAQVVSRLFSIVNPHKAYFGKKDFQQLAIIKRMVEMLSIPVEIISCNTVREPDGLAKSSRNLLLSKEHRASAPLIYKTLTEARNFKGEKSVKETIKWVEGQINADTILKVEYFAIADSKTLEPISNWTDTNEAVGCIAVWAGKVRLIDNIVFNLK